MPKKIHPDFKTAQFTNNRARFIISRAELTNLKYSRGLKIVPGRDFPQKPLK